MIEVVLPYLIEQAPLLVVVGFGVWSLTRRDGDRKLHESRLADSIDGLAKKLDKVVDAIEHMDGRLNQHDTEIALLKQGRK